MLQQKAENRKPTQLKIILFYFMQLYVFPDTIQTP